ncbi:hypothetical protein GBO60_01235 [Pediococcus acidilactici]|nr:hypothetical protein GBO60_01235 [Pediococcus acidilactici]KAF0391634.1 hypothetical protein GBO67_01235 [Pediococcus acidilactici]
MRKWITRADLIAFGCTVVTMFLASKINFIRVHEGWQFLTTLLIFVILDFICKWWFDNPTVK